MVPAGCGRALALVLASACSDDPGWTPAAPGTVDTVLESTIDGMPKVLSLEGLAAGPDDTLYLVDQPSTDRRAWTNVIAVPREGPARLLVGVPENSVDDPDGGHVGGFPTLARPPRIFDSIAVAPDGTVYLDDEDNFAVRAIDPDGTRRAVAGTGTEGFSGDGGPAIQAGIRAPRHLAVDAATGDLYICETYFTRVSRKPPAPRSIAQPESDSTMRLGPCTSPRSSFASGYPRSRGSRETSSRRWRPARRPRPPHRARRQPGRRHLFRRGRPKRYPNGRPELMKLT